MKLTFLLLLLASALLANAAPPRDAEEKVPAIVAAEREWKGSGDDRDLAKQKPAFIASAAELKKLWEDWKMEGEPPAIDFTRSLVVLQTTVGSSLRLILKLDEAGDLKVLGMGTKDIRPGFRYVVAQVSLAGVKSVNGQALVVPK